MASQDLTLAEAVSVLNNALQVALLLAERDLAVPYAGANAARIRDAVCKAAKAAQDLRPLMARTDGRREHPAAAATRDAEVSSHGNGSARHVSMGAAVGAALGGLLQGVRGALTGAAIGAGGATVYELATHATESTSSRDTKIGLTRVILLWPFAPVTMNE